VPLEEIVPSLMPLFLYFKTAREGSECFGEFCHRRGLDDLQAWGERYTAQAVS
jgi:hypothetical protein